MKTVLDQSTREELVGRILSLQAHSKPLWGRMNVFQMLRHCVRCEEMYLGGKKYKRALLGRIFGRMGLKNLLKDDKPLQKNAPTSDSFKVSETNGDVEIEKQKWIDLIRAYENYSADTFEHWFFGKMTREQVGQFAYKHSDHHLRQFNC